MHILMIERKENIMKSKPKGNTFEKQKLDLIRLRIRNKFYEREEILQKVVQDIYEYDLRNK